MSLNDFFSSDLPFARRGDGSDQLLEDDKQSFRDNEENQDLESFLPSNHTFFFTNPQDNNETQNLKRVNFRENPLKKTKPNIMAWVDIFDKIPIIKTKKIFEYYDMKDTNDSRNWLKLYDILSNDELKDIIEKYESDRIVEIDLNDNTDSIFNNNSENKVSEKVDTQLSDRPENLSVKPKYTYSKKKGSISQFDTPNIEFGRIDNNSIYKSKTFNNQTPLMSTNSITETVFTTTSKPISSTGSSFNTFNITQNLDPFELRIDTDSDNYSKGKNIIQPKPNKEAEHLVTALENLAIGSNIDNRPPIFYTDSDPKIWLKKFEKSALINGWKDIHKVKHFPKFVCDEVVSWITENLSYDSIDWNDLKAEFLSEFQCRDKGISNRVKLTKLKQESNESVRSYFRRALDLCDAVNEQMSTKEKVDILTFGLKYEIRNKILNVGIWPLTNGIKQLKEIAISVENFIEMNKAIDYPYNKTNNQKISPTYKVKGHNLRNDGIESKFFAKFKNQKKEFKESSFEQNKKNSSEIDYEDDNKFIYQCFRCGDLDHKIYECPLRKRDAYISRRLENEKPNFSNNSRIINYNKSYDNNRPCNQAQINYPLRNNKRYFNLSGHSRKTESADNIHKNNTEVKQIKQTVSNNKTASIPNSPNKNVIESKIVTTDLNARTDPRRVGSEN